MGGDLHRRRVDRRHLCSAPPAARLRPAGARGALQAQLRPASGDACGPRAGARGANRDDGRRPAERAGGHSEAPRRPRPRRCGFRAARRAPRLAGPDAAEPCDQRAAAPVHRRLHLRLRLRVQRLPAGGDRADAGRDRPAEVHEGARALERGLGRGSRRVARRRRAPARGIRRSGSFGSPCTSSPDSGPSRCSGSG